MATEIGGKLTLYAPLDVSPLLLSGATLTDGTVVIDDLKVTRREYSETLPETASYSGRTAISNLSISTAFESSSYMILDSVTVSGITDVATAYKVTGGFPYIFGGRFTSNTGLTKGAIFNSNKIAENALNVKGTLFDNNSAVFGGAIFASGSTTVVYGATFSDNDAVVSGKNGGIGGAIYQEGAANTDVYHTLFSGNEAAASGGATYVAGGSLQMQGNTFSNNTAAAYGGAVYIAAQAAERNFIDTVFAGNRTLNAGSQKPRGGAVFVQSLTSTQETTTVVGFTRTLFDNNSCADLGGAVFGRYNSALNFYGATFQSNSSDTNGGAINFSSSDKLTIGESTRDGQTVRSEFTGNSADTGGAIYMTAGSAVITSADFKNNSAVSGGAIYVNKNASITVTSSVFEGNSAGNLRYGGAICNAGTINISDTRFLGDTDSINNSGTVNFSGAITISSRLTNSGTVNFTDAAVTFGNGQTIAIEKVNFSGTSLTFAGSAAVNFAADQAWDAVTAITVKGAGFLPGNQHIALVARNLLTDKVTAETGYTLLRESESRDLYITSATIFAQSDYVKVVGSGDNLFTGKASGSFFAATAPTATIISTITGEVGGTVIGGQWANGSTGYEYATGGDVTLNLNGAQIGDTSHVYGGGYMYGDNKAKPEAAQMKVDEVNMTLSGDDTTAKGLLFGGIHAREYGYAQVGEVNITVDGGTYGRIHGGGWAEKGAYSVVDKVNINVKSGTVQYIYAGGCNATTEANYQTINGTSVGSADITINSAATVTYVYLGARYAAGKITGDVTLTVTGEDTANIRRITGWGSTGMDSSANGNSIVKLETSVDTVYFDYVDQLTINENCTLNIETSASFGSGQDIEIALALDADGLTGNWDIITGDGVAGIMDAVSSFTLGDTSVAWDKEAGSIALGDYTLTYDEDGKKLTLGLA